MQNDIVQPTANLNVMNALGGNITVRNDGVLREVPVRLEMSICLQREGLDPELV